jgi:hypothetical protein
MANNRKPPLKVENPLRSGPYVDAYYGIHANTRRRRLDAGQIPPPDRFIAGRPYWFDSTIRAAGTEETPRLKADLPAPLRQLRQSQ